MVITIITGKTMNAIAMEKNMPMVIADIITTMVKNRNANADTIKKKIMNAADIMERIMNATAMAKVIIMITARNIIARTIRKNIITTTRMRRNTIVLMGMNILTITNRIITTIMAILMHMGITMNTETWKIAMQ